MAAVKVTDLKNRATDIVRRVEKGESYVVTKRGRPVAVIFPAETGDLEDWVLANHPEAVRRWREAERRVAAGEFVTAAELRALLPYSRRRRR